MAQINVTQFAKELGLPIELLIEQLQTAGVKKKLADDTVLTEKDKTQLLDQEFDRQTEFLCELSDVDLCHGGLRV